MKYVKYISLILLSHIVFVCTNLQDLKGNDPEFIASAPSTVTVGKAFNYVITGNENIRGSVQLPDLDGIRVVAGPSTFISTQSSFVNGKMENVTTVTFSYNLIATREGNITIPPATLKAGNKTLTTNSVDLKAVPDRPATPQTQPPTGPQSSRPAQSTENYYIRLIPSKRSVYLGESLVLEAKIHTSERLSFSEVKFPEFEGFWKQELEADQQTAREIINGKEFLYQVFKRDLILPQKTGNLKIDPAVVTVMVQKRIRSQRRSLFGDLFDDPFFDSFENVPEVLTSNALNIEVKPLPSGAPAGFDGAVGQYTLDFVSDREQAKVNDAISLKLTLRGKGNLSLLKAPKINLPPDVEIFEPKTSRNINHTINGSTGSISYEYIIIPRYAGKYRIAPIDFAYFDPIKQSYQSIRTREITLNVEPGGDSDPGAISGLQQQAPGVIRERVGNLNTDILFIKTTLPDFQKSDFDLAESLAFRLAFPAGIFTYIFLVIFYRKRIKQNSNLAYLRNKKARRKAEKRLRAARNLLGVNDKLMYEEILKALWDYLSDKLNVPRAELSRKTVEEGLIKFELNPEVINELWNVISECEMAGYATGSNSEPSVIYSKSEDLLYKYEQILR